MTSNKFIILLMCAFLCVIVSCQKSQKTATTIPAVIMAENAKRAALGLRLVKTNWFLYSVQFSEENWKINSTDGYWAKKIHRDANGTIVWEEDYYYSGKTFLFPPDKGIDWEKVTVHYDYSTSLLTVSYIGLDPYIIGLFGDSGPIVQMTNNMSVADQILKKWGIPRL